MTPRRASPEIQPKINALGVSTLTAWENNTDRRGFLRDAAMAGVALRGACHGARLWGQNRFSHAGRIDVRHQPLKDGTEAARTLARRANEFAAKARPTTRAASGFSRPSRCPTPTEACAKSSMPLIRSAPTARAAVVNANSISLSHQADGRVRAHATAGERAGRVSDREGEIQWPRRMGHRCPLRCPPQSTPSPQSRRATMSRNRAFESTMLCGWRAS